jgi:hypothetical protein
MYSMPCSCVYSFSYRHTQHDNSGRIAGHTIGSHTLFGGVVKRRWAWGLGVAYALHWAPLSSRTRASRAGFDYDCWGHESYSFWRRLVVVVVILVVFRVASSIVKRQTSLVAGLGSSRRRRPWCWSRSDSGAVLDTDGSQSVLVLAGRLGIQKSR